MRNDRSVVTSLLATTVRFTWREAKSRTNRRKHGVDFETAARVFADPFHVMEQDRIEDGERRWQTVGRAHGITLRLAAHTVTEDDEDDEDGRPVERIHIISARKADRKESRR